MNFYIGAERLLLPGVEGHVLPREDAGQYTTRSVPTNDDLLEMHRRMLLIRGFEERVAALYRDGEIPGFVHLSIGQEATAVGACWPLGPADVITSTHRGHGHCLAKGLDPLGMFAELMGRDRAATAAAAARCTSPIRPRHLRRQRHRRRGAADRRRRRDRGPAPGRRRRRGRLLRRRRGRPGRVPRGGQPGRGVAAAGGLLLREQRLRRVLGRRRRSTRRRSSSGPPATASSYIAVDGNDVGPSPRHGRGRRGRARPGEGPTSSRPTPTAGTATTRATRSATGRPTSGRSGRPAIRSLLHARRAARRRCRRRRLAALEARSPGSSTPRSTRPGARRARRRRRCSTSCVRPRPDVSRAVEPRPPDEPVFRTMDADPTALENELGGRRPGVRRRDRRRRRGQRLRPHPWAARALRRPGARHADLGDRDRRPRRRRGDGGHAPGGRDHVPRLHRRLPRPAAQPGGQAAVHDRRRAPRWR